MQPLEGWICIRIKQGLWRHKTFDFRTDGPSEKTEILWTLIKNMHQHKRVPERIQSTEVIFKDLEWLDLKEELAEDSPLKIRFCPETSEMARSIPIDSQSRTDSKSQELAQEHIAEDSERTRRSRQDTRNSMKRENPLHIPEGSDTQSVEQKEDHSNSDDSRKRSAAQQRARINRQIQLDHDKQRIDEQRDSERKHWKRELHAGRVRVTQLERELKEIQSELTRVTVRQHRTQREVVLRSWRKPLEKKLV